MKIIKTLGIIFVFTLFLHSEEDFRIIESWRPGYETFGRASHAIINDDGNIVAVFYKTGARLITPKKIVSFAPRGQGPGDLTDMMALFHYHKDIAFVESPEKVKIFRKDGETYKIQEIKWLKRGKYVHVISDGIFLDNKFFLTGFEFLEYDNDKKITHTSLLKIYNEKGKPLKNLIKKSFDKPNQFYLMNYYVADYKNFVFFLAENELKVYLISVTELHVKKEVNLDIPGFYRSMPENFYIWKRYNEPNKSFSLDIDTWKTSYSRINKVIVEGDFLILQMRTFSDKLKKFALLFYNANNFKLEKTIFTNDLLINAKDGKYYFYANGDPGYDDEAEEFIIHIYGFGDKKNKLSHQYP